MMDDDVVRSDLDALAPDVDLEAMWSSQVRALRVDDRRRRMNRFGVLTFVLVLVGSVSYLGTHVGGGTGAADKTSIATPADQVTSPTANSTPTTATPVPEGMTSVPEEIVQFYKEQQRTGLKQVDTVNGVKIYVRLKDLMPGDPIKAPKPGDRLDAVDSTGAVIGYYIPPIGYVPREVADDPAFDWQAEARRMEESPQTP